MISKFTSAVRTGITASLMLIATLTANAQVQANEGFNQPTGNAVAPLWPANNLPFGWSMSVGTDVNAYWDRMNNPGVLPACTPFGTAMVRARTAYQTAINDTTYLVSKPYDLSARGVGVVSNARFWIYRDAAAGNDNISVFANNAPTATGGTLLFDTASFTTIIPRQASQAPAEAVGWRLHGFAIPATTYSTANCYIIIRVIHASAGVTSNVYIDDFSITTYPSAMVYNTVALITQNSGLVAKNTTNNDIIGMNINVTNSATPLAVGNFQFIPNGSTQTNPMGIDVSLVKLWWTGGTPQFNPLTATLVTTYGGSMSPNFLMSGAAVTLENGNNYFWLSYDVPAGAISNDCIDADFIDVVVGGLTRVCNITGCSLPGCRLIDVAYCIPTYTAGDSWLNGSYTDNDYVKWVVCQGDPSYPPGINNDHNEVPVGMFPVGAGWPADPCVTSSTMIMNGTVSPFATHPPDYQRFSTSTSPAMAACTGAPYNHPNPSSRTAVFLETSVAPPSYNITVQVGTWFGANCIAAWIDFNHDGLFNNNMWNVAGGEKLIQSGYMNMLTFISGNFSVPVTGYYGPTTMRVREWYANPSMDACSPGYYGEVEDYTVTLRPDCSPLFPGWKIWLGYTDDWNVNSNWCGGIPTLSDNALIPGKGGAGYNRGPATYHPVIKTGVAATTKRLLMLNDTVEVNAPTGGSLRVTDTLLIGTAATVNTSALIVDSSYLGSATVLNGNFTDNNQCPFRAGLKEHKMELMYKTTELLGQGLIDGDIIDEIWVPLRTRGSTQPYPVTITMWYSDNSNPNYPTFTTTGFVGAVPLAGDARAPINGASQQVVYNPAISGNILMTSQVPGASGTYHIVLTNPFRFDAVTAGGRPLIIEFCYTMAVTCPNDLMWQTNTASFRSVMFMSHLSSAMGSGCSFVNGNGLNSKLTSTLRPNLIFKFHRVFQRFPITMETLGSTANWYNHGNFVPANSKVTFMGTSVSTQLIDGTNSTTFDELAINNNVGYVQQNKATTVNDTLFLQTGRLRLNGLNLTLNNTTLGAITRTNGYLQSENLPPNYGTIEWKMGGTIGVHTFPFITTQGSYIPFTYTAVSGTSDLKVGTYYPSTNPVSMLPYPTGVTTVNSYNNPAVTDAPNMVKRFWVLTNTGVAPNADLTFQWNNTIAPVETPANGAAPSLMSQRWQGGAITWDYPAAGQTNPLINSVMTPGVTVFNTPWALTRLPEPLPIKLLNFTAKAEKTKVRLDWVTASEMNNDFFTVDRTLGNNDFTFIDRVQSRGPSSNTQEYYTYDNSPLMGRQFYRLKQTDLNGKSIYSDLVPVDFGSSGLGAPFEITTVKNYENGTTDVIFKYNSELPLTYKLVDKLGKIILSKSISKPINGLNIITLDENLSSGIYTLMIQSQSETITKKIFR